MSRETENSTLDGTSADHEDPPPDEYQPLRPQSSDSDSNKVDDFASSHGLTHKLDVLRKASSLLDGDSPEDISEITRHEINVLQKEVSNKWQQPKLLYFTILVCSTGAIEQGWGQTSMNGANLYFPQALGIGSDSARDAFIVGLINSSLYLSICFFGAWISEPLNNRLGRRGAIFAGSILCLLGNLGCSISWTWQILLFFRLLLGTGLGINASTVSVYAAECAPASIRGGLAVSWQLFTAFGIFIGFLANILFYGHGANTWRLQLGAPSIPAVVLMAIIYSCPESPAWYVKKGRYGLAYQSLNRLRNTELQAAKEIYASYLEETATPKFANHSRSYLAKFSELFTIPRIRNATVASYTIVLSQQLCGINTFSFYLSTIFTDAGFSTFGALAASCAFGFVNFLGAFPAIWTMDTLGRRSLLLWTLPFMAITMFAIGLTFKMQEGTAQLVLLASLIYLFCAEYSPGLGPVPVIYSAESFPLSHRGIGMSMAIATANFWATLLSLTFPGLLAGIGSEGVFELYAGLNVVALVLVFLFVRETKKRTLYELDAVFAVGMGEFVTGSFRGLGRE